MALATQMAHAPIDPAATAPRGRRRIAARAPALVALHRAHRRASSRWSSPFVWMILGSFKTTPRSASTRPSSCPAIRRSRTTRSCSAGSISRRSSSTASSSRSSSRSATSSSRSMIGYALAKLEFRGKKLLFALVLAHPHGPGCRDVRAAVRAHREPRPGQLLPRPDPAVPHHAARGVPDAAVHASLPDELIEAARIDGAGEWRIFLRVIMPMCGPAVATLTILTFLASWNNFLWPLVVATTEDMYTLPVALALYSVGQNAAAVRPA